VNHTPVVYNVKEEIQAIDIYFIVNKSRYYFNDYLFVGSYKHFLSITNTSFYVLVFRIGFMLFLGRGER